MATKHATHPFEVSGDIIRHLIESQSGTLEKALLEAVTNAVDAKASIIRITFPDHETIVIEDDGIGFTSEEDVHRHFGIFGFAHDTADETERERTFGQFGLGRGQLFAWATTRWESNHFALDVDIRARRFRYKLEEHDKRLFPGCRITARLYRALNHLARQRLCHTLKKWIRYAPIAAEIDERAAKTGTDNEQWTTETDTFLFRAHPHTDHGVAVYNLGVYVTTYPHETLGTSGILVTKPGKRLALNLARNEVLQNHCTIWREAKSLLKNESERARRKGRLTNGTRQALLHEALWADGDRYATAKIPILPLANGRFMSPRQAARHADGALTVAPQRNSAAAEQIHGQALATVCSPELLDWTDSEDVNTLTARLNTVFDYDAGVHQRYRPLDYNELARGFDNTATVIEPEKLTKTQKAALAGLAVLSDELTAAMYWNRERHWVVGRIPSRRIAVGVSNTFEAWTDGNHWIAIEQNVLAAALTAGPDGWFRLYHLLLHEYCHDEANAEDHVHSPEFLQTYHDFVLSSAYRGHEHVTRAHAAYIRARKRLKLPDAQRIARERDRIDRLLREAAPTKEKTPESA